MNTDREAILDILRAAGFDMTDDAVLSVVRTLVSERKVLVDANCELGEEIRRLAPFQAEALVLRQQLEYMRDLVKTAIVQAGIAEQTRESWNPWLRSVAGEIRRFDGRVEHVTFEHRSDGRWVPTEPFAVTPADQIYLAFRTNKDYDRG